MANYEPEGSFRPPPARWEAHPDPGAAWGAGGDGGDTPPVTPSSWLGATLENLAEIVAPTLVEEEDTKGVSRVCPKRLPHVAHRCTTIARGVTPSCSLESGADSVQRRLSTL